MDRSSGYLNWEFSGSRVFGVDYGIFGLTVSGVWGADARDVGRYLMGSADRWFHYFPSSCALDGGVCELQGIPIVEFVRQGVGLGPWREGLGSVRGIFTISGLCPGWILYR